jgi:protein O-GlcNAc transferase
MQKNRDFRPQVQNLAAVMALQAKFIQGLTLHQQGKLADAERIYGEILQHQPSHFDALHLLGVIAYQTRRTERAVELISKAISLNANVADAHSNLGNALRDLNRPGEALMSCDRAIALKPDYTEAHSNRGLALQDLKRPADALLSYDRAIALNPGYAKAHSNRGNALKELNRSEEAVASYDRAIALNPDYAEAHYNRGVALWDLKRLEEAVASYDLAIALQPELAEAHCNRGNALPELERLEEAVASYDRAIALNPDYAEVYSNRGNALKDLKRLKEAVASYDKAIALKPDYAEAYNNRGIALQDLKRLGDALGSFDRAIALKPDYAGAYNNRGNVLATLRRHDEAYAAYDKALMLNPELIGTAGARLHSKMHICDWSGFDAECRQLVTGIENGDLNTEIFALLAIPSSPDIQVQYAKRWIANKCPPSTESIWRGQRYSHRRIRVAYVSADFREHPVAHLLASMFEQHDRTQFETFGIALGPDDQSEMRLRMKRAFDRFIDVENKSDRDVVRLIRELEIDIVIDLMGFTSGSRPAILTLRSSPIQVNYLSYPGIVGTGCIDYILADRFVIPENHRALFSEPVVYLPDTYLGYDSKQIISDRVPTRVELGLPETGFVFCVHNNSFKITPAFFDIWMRLLSRIPGSVLWLSATNATAKSNLRREAQAHGVDPNRLYFAPFVKDMADHLARYRLADIFLDTLPFNAHTTACDALWAGLPVLTCLGSTFVGRVAAGLLNAVGLSELITHSLEEYEALAAKLATDSSLLASIKAKLARNRNNNPLFDSWRFTRHVEASYTQMWERQQRGERPTSFAVKQMN